MSGGSMDYTYCKINEYANDLMDKEMTELAKDMAEVFRAAEWWHSCDSGEDTYRQVVSNFKGKWFAQDRTERLKAYIDESIDKARKECMDLIGAFGKPKGEAE